MNVQTMKRLAFGCCVAAFMLPLSAAAQNGSRSGPPINEMAAQLHVSAADLQTCMPRPAQGTRPERPDPSAITACLKAKNPKITQQAVEETLKAFSPERPQRSN